MRVYIFCSLKSSTFTQCRFLSCWNKVFSIIVFTSLTKLPSVLTFTYLILEWYLATLGALKVVQTIVINICTGTYGKLNFFYPSQLFCDSYNFSNDQWWWLVSREVGNLGCDKVKCNRNALCLWQPHCRSCSWKTPVWRHTIEQEGKTGVAEKMASCFCCDALWPGLVFSVRGLQCF